MKGTGFISLTYRRTIFEKKIRVFGFMLAIKILSRPINYKTGKRADAILKNEASWQKMIWREGLKSGEVGEICGVKFIKTKLVKGKNGKSEK